MKNSVQSLTRETKRREVVVSSKEGVSERGGVR